MPERDELPGRLESVLEVIYLIFNEGYAASAGEEWIRPELIEEALRLGRILAELLPAEPEVHGLVALMELQASRSRARIGPRGEAIPLDEQDRSRWDWVLMRAARRRSPAPSARGAVGPYGLQAAIAGCHADARTPAETDWERIAALYDGLAQLTRSPVVELNRAVAVGMAFGPEAGLRIVDGLAEEPAMSGYHLLPAVRGDLLSRLGRRGEAIEEFERAASLTGNSGSARSSRRGPSSSTDVAPRGRRGRSEIVAAPEPHIKRRAGDQQAADAVDGEHPEGTDVVDHPGEVHPEEAGDEAERQEDGGDQGQLLAGLVLLQR